MRNSSGKSYALKCLQSSALFLRGLLFLFTVENLDLLCGGTGAMSS